MTDIDTNDPPDAMVTDFTATFSTAGAEPFSWTNGDVITYSQNSWGNGSSASGQLLLAT